MSIKAIKYVRIRLFRFSLLFALWLLSVFIYIIQNTKNLYSVICHKLRITFVITFQDLRKTLANLLKTLQPFCAKCNMCVYPWYRLGLLHVSVLLGKGLNHQTAALRRTAAFILPLKAAAVFLVYNLSKT